MNMGNDPQVYITVITVICWYKHHRPEIELGSKFLVLSGSRHPQMEKVLPSHQKLSF